MAENDLTSAFGFLALHLGRRLLPLQVCRSKAGFYIGTVTPEGEPFSRESAEYWQTREEAERILQNANSGWTQRLTP